MITYDDFEKVDIRVGKVIKVEEFPEAINPSYILTIDFGGEIGVKKSSGQFKGAYPNMTVIEGRLVIGVVNFPPKKIGPFESIFIKIATTKHNRLSIIKKIISALFISRAGNNRIFNFIRNADS